MMVRWLCLCVSAVGVMAMESVLTEREVQLVWLLGMFRGRTLLCEDGRPVEVLFPGFPAGEGGPDFRGARVRMGGCAREGDVEVHLTPAGWRRHGHAGDAAYAGVILHVALRRDPFDRGTRGLAGPIAELILEPYLDVPPAEIAGRLLRAAPAAPAPSSLERMGQERVAGRVRTLVRLARALGADGALYREMMIGLGYRHNKPGFAELARLVPWPRVRGLDAAAARAAYASVAGSLPWRRCGRPANRPARRLDGWARFVASVGDAGLVEMFAGDPRRAEARLDPDGTGLIGPQRARDLVVNAVLPALIAFGAVPARLAARERLSEPDPAPANRRVREAAEALGIAVPRGTLARLGLLEWRSRP